MLVERADGGIVTVAINRPEKNNALNRSTWLGLAGAYRELAQDPSVRCIVLRGAGKAFSSGADISEFASGRANPPSARTMPR